MADGAGTADSPKTELRRHALGRRDGLSEGQRAAAAAAIAAASLPVELQPGTVLAGYFPINSEIDPFPLMRVFASRGARLALPVIIARDHALLFRAWKPDDQLVRGPFGIFQPSSDAMDVEPDIVLLPLAAFDRAGHRIGYGRGYYDRTLMRLRAVKRITVIGLAFSVQEIKSVPAAPHDEQLDCVLTERELIDLRPL